MCLASVEQTVPSKGFPRGLDTSVTLGSPRQPVALPPDPPKSASLLTSHRGQEARGSHKSQDLTTIPPGEERPSWLAPLTGSCFIISKSGWTEDSGSSAGFLMLRRSSRPLQYQLTRRGGAWLSWPLTMDQLHWNLDH